MCSVGGVSAPTKGMPADTRKNVLMCGRTQRGTRPSPSTLSQYHLGLYSVLCAALWCNGSTGRFDRSGSGSSPNAAA